MGLLSNREAFRFQARNGPSANGEQAVRLRKQFPPDGAFEMRDSVKSFRGIRYENVASSGKLGYARMVTENPTRARSPVRPR